VLFGGRTFHVCGCGAVSRAHNIAQCAWRGDISCANIWRKSRISCCFSKSKLAYQNGGPMAPHCSRSAYLSRRVTWRVAVARFSCCTIMAAAGLHRHQWLSFGAWLSAKVRGAGCAHLKNAVAAPARISWCPRPQHKTSRRGAPLLNNAISRMRGMLLLA